jgi:acetyl esterase/lipase
MKPRRLIDPAGRFPLSPALLGLLALLFAGQAATAEQPSAPRKQHEVVTIKDVAYYQGKDADRVRHKLDLFVPKGKKGYPVVVFLHGGAWMYGDKSVSGLYSAVGRCLAENGVGAVFPNYRLSPWVQHPEHIRDVARAFAWTHRHIAEHGGKPDRLFVGGHSAGAHLAALLATDDTYLRAEGLSRGNIRGVIAVSGIYRIPEKLSVRLPNLGGATGRKVELGFNPFEVVFGKDARARRAASPLHHVCPGLPPFLVVYAQHELLLLPEQAEEFVEALKEKKCDVERLRIKGRHHGSIVFKATTPDDPLADAMLRFVEKHCSR